MSLVLITVLMGVFFIAAALKWAEYLLNKETSAKAIKPKSKYDVNYVRQKEMEIWGYYFTPVPEPEKKAIPTPTGGSGGVSPVPHWSHRYGKYNDNPVRKYNCAVCDNAVMTKNPTRTMCNPCTMDITQERKEQRESERQKKIAEYKAKQQERTAYTSRTREVEYKGERYRAHVPTEVPDNAHAEIMETFKHGDPYGTWMMFKWTNPNTGKTMGLRTVARPVDRYEFESMDGCRREFYA